MYFVVYRVVRNGLCGVVYCVVYFVLWFVSSKYFVQSFSRSSKLESHNFEINSEID